MDDQAHTTARQPSEAHQAPRSSAPDHPDRDQLGMPDFLDWVRENQTVAMLGAFAVGVFVGVMMRD